MTKPYRKLPGHKRGVIATSSAWLGDDHLLLVRSARFWEDYRRFYFRDIQAVIVTRKRYFFVPSPLLAAALFLTPGLLLRHWAAFAIFVPLFLYWMGASLWQSCLCQIQTAVSLEALPSVYRMWTARKMVDILEERIRQAQPE